LKQLKVIQAEVNSSIKLDWRNLHEAMVTVYLFLQSNDEGQVSFDVTQYSSS